MKVTGLQGLSGNEGHEGHDQMKSVMRDMTSINVTGLHHPSEIGTERHELTSNVRRKSAPGIFLFLQRSKQPLIE